MLMRVVLALLPLLGALAIVTGTFVCLDALPHAPRLWPVALICGGWLPLSETWQKLLHRWKL